MTTSVSPARSWTRPQRIRLLRERVTPGLVVLSLIPVGGTLLVIYQPGGAGSPIGVLLTVAGVACCAAVRSIGAPHGRGERGLRLFVRARTLR